MRLTIPELAIKIGIDEFDDHDLLDRKGLAKQLSELVDRIDDPIVIALDGSWGSGKSVFLKLWVGEHNQNDGAKARVIYFDAFENDFLDDPLIGLVGAIAKHLPLDGRDRQGLAKLKGVALSLGRSALRVGVAWATAGAIKDLDEIGDAVAGSISDESMKIIDGLWQKEQGKAAAMEQFREALVTLTEPMIDDGPRQKIVLIVDELDRCRPDYALSMLETIKHFFAVDGVHFVLGVNMRAVENSVKARYGSGIDAAGYLQKFIHLTLPLTTSKSETTALQYFKAVSKTQGIGAELYNSIRPFFDLPGIAAKMSVRDVQRLMTRAVLLPAFQGYDWPYEYIVLSATFLTILFPKHYDRFRQGSLPFATFATAFGLSEPQDSNTGWPDSLWHLSNCWLSADPGDTTMEFIKPLMKNMSPGKFQKEFVRHLSGALDTFTLPNQPVA